MGELVWQKSTSIPDYLCFTALEAGQFTLTIPAAVTPTYLSYVEWSKDGRNWTRLTVDDTAQSVTTPIIPVGEYLIHRLRRSPDGALLLVPVGASPEGKAYLAMKPGDRQRPPTDWVLRV